MNNTIQPEEGSPLHAKRSSHTILMIASVCLLAGLGIGYLVAQYFPDISPHIAQRSETITQEEQLSKTSETCLTGYEELERVEGNDQLGNPVIVGVYRAPSSLLSSGNCALSTVIGIPDQNGLVRDLERFTDNYNNASQANVTVHDLTLSPKGSFVAYRVGQYHVSGFIIVHVPTGIVILDALPEISGGVDEVAWHQDTEAMIFSNSINKEDFHAPLVWENNYATTDDIGLYVNETSGLPNARRIISVEDLPMSFENDYDQLAVEFYDLAFVDKQTIQFTVRLNDPSRTEFIEETYMPRTFTYDLENKTLSSL